MNRLSLSFLGPPLVELDGRPVVHFGGANSLALLAYLAIEGDRPHRRETLASMLWPDRTDREALSSLRFALSNLRHAIGDKTADPPVLVISRETIQFDPSAGVRLDVQLFRDGVAAKLPMTSTGAVEPLAKTLDLYRGDLLAGLALDGSPVYEEWLLFAREQMNRLAGLAFQRLTELREARGEYVQAQDCARRHLRLEPWNEEVHRRLMHNLAANGQRGAALAQYEACVRVLRDDLGVEPAPETRLLAKNIEAGLLDRRAEVIVSATSGFSPSPLFVGREEQLGKMEGFLRAAQSGKGGIVFVTGEAGSGKTALLQEFSRRAMAQNLETVVSFGNCDAYATSGVPYQPFREMLQMLGGDIEARRAGGTISQEHSRRLWETLPHLVQVLIEEGPELADRFVSRETMAGWIEAFAAGGDSKSARLASRLKTTPAGTDNLSQSDLFERFGRVLRKLSRRWVLVLILDDLQWTDRGTVSLLSHFSRRLAGSRILLVGAYRPYELIFTAGPERHPLEQVVNEMQRQHGDIVIDLDATADLSLVDALLDREANLFDTDFRNNLLRHTGGNALFVLELLREMKECGEIVPDQQGRWVAERPNWARLPARVESVISKRVESLAPHWRELLTVASVEGTEFSAELVAQVLDLDAAQVRRDLSGRISKEHGLVQASRVDWPAGQRVSRYRFTHHLLRTYLYRQQDPVERATRHAAVGQLLEAQCAGQPAQLAAMSPTLAWHFDAAGRVDKAVTFLLHAGWNAHRMAAPAAAISFYRRGLYLVQQMPQSEERDKLELTILNSLYPSMSMADGWGTRESMTMLRRAFTLGTHLGDTSMMLPILRSLADSCIGAGEYQHSLGYSEQLLALAEKERDPLFQACGHRSIGTSHLFLGNYELAKAHLERGVGFLDDANVFGEGAALNRDREAVLARCWLPYVLLAMGYADQAAARAVEVVALARSLNDTNLTMTAVATAGAMFHAVARRPQKALDRAAQLLTLTGEKPPNVYRAWAGFYHGWGLSMQQQADRGLAQMAQAIHQVLATGMQAFLPHLYCLLAEASVRNGLLDPAQDAIHAAQSHAARTGSRAYLAEIYRTQGDVLTMAGSVDEAERCLTEAANIARQQQTRLFELRATISLARLWSSSGRSVQAYTQLLEIVNWFGEGLDLADLRDGRQLLSTLARVKSPLR